MIRNSSYSRFFKLWGVILIIFGLIFFIPLALDTSIIWAIVYSLLGIPVVLLFFAVGEILEELSWIGPKIRENSNKTRKSIKSLEEKIANLETKIIELSNDD